MTETVKLSDTQKRIIEKKLTELPLCSYGYLPVDQIPFSEKVRHICETECIQYGKSWSCPPAVGTVEECRKRAEQYSEVFVFTTMAEVEDMENMALMLSTRKDHESITKTVTKIFREEGWDTLTLSTESCVHCRQCTYPDRPCRHPELMYPCVESYGILVVELAERCGISFMQEGGIVTWFSAILIK